MTEYRDGEVIPAPPADWLRSDSQWIKTPGVYQLLCPTCGSLNARCNGVYFAEASDAGWRGDGQVTRINFACDQGHYWRLCFGVDQERTWCWLEGARPQSGEEQPEFGDDTDPDTERGDDEDAGYP